MSKDIPCINCLVAVLCANKIENIYDRVVRDYEWSYDHDLELAYEENSYEDMCNYFVFISIGEYAEFDCSILGKYVEKFNDLKSRETAIYAIDDYLRSLKG